MKKNVRKNDVSSKIDRLTGIVQRGFKSVEEKMELKFSTVAEDIADIQDIMATKADIADMATKTDMKELEIKIDKIDNKLNSFEKNELDKRKLLEVRVTKLGSKVLSH